MFDLMAYRTLISLNQRFISSVIRRHENSTIPVSQVLFANFLEDRTFPKILGERPHHTKKARDVK